MDGLPIGDYGLLSDCRSAALVSRAGSVDWLCFPRFDSPAVLARILDPGAGHFAIRPAGEFQASRAYADQTMVLETRFRTASGTAVLTDAMAVGRTEAEARAAGLRVTVVTTATGEVPGAYTQGNGIGGTSQLVIDDDSRTVAGATFTGPGLQELLHSATVAITGGVTVDRLWHAVPSFPTVSEVWLHLLEAYGL